MCAVINELMAQSATVNVVENAYKLVYGDSCRCSPRFQNCTLCHQKIHGSYVSKELLK